MSTTPSRQIFPFLWMRGESEAVLREEIEKISECGIGAVCVEARPHQDFCGPGWWHDMDIVLDEARRRDMKVWILDDKHFPTGYAAGLIEQKYPERKKQYLACTVADVFGSARPITLQVSRMLKPSIGFWEIGKPVNEAERSRNRLLSLTAVRFEEGNRFTGEAIDLTDTCQDGFATFRLPEGQWRVHALYITRTDGGDETYINMLDPVSAHTQIEGVYEAHYARYADEFGKTIAGFFSDEPQLGNTLEQCYDTKPGKPKMPLPWSEALLKLLQERIGEGWRSRLAYLFARDAEGVVAAQMRYVYMDAVSELYAKNFARPIGQWCRDHGVEYIGHVVEDNGVHSRLGLGAAHWFRAMEGQDMAGIDMIGGQYVFGAPVQERCAMTPCDGEFFHYALGKLGASGGHLDPKKKGRTMCELFGAYGWTFGVRDMRYLLDHLLTRGINHLVPHAFSMAEYPDPDCPPHFYARGHNPQFPYFASLMHYAGRMCAQLTGGQHISSVAVLYDGELDWAGEHMPMQKLCRELTEHQIDYDIVSLDMLRHLKDYNGALRQNLLEINGITFQALIVPEAEFIPQGLLAFIRNAAPFPVIVAGCMPKGVLHDESGEPLDTTLLHALTVIPIEELCITLTHLGMRHMTFTPDFPALSVYAYEKDGLRLMLMNESPDVSCKGCLTLHDIPVGTPVWRYDGMTDTYAPVPTVAEDTCIGVFLNMAPGESCLLVTRLPEGAQVLEEQYIPLSERLAACPAAMDLSDAWQVCCRNATGEAVAYTPQTDKLHPVSDELPDFSGTICYTRHVSLDKKPTLAVLSIAEVYEVMRVAVNGQDAGIRLTPPYALDISAFVQPGDNEICVEVASTPARDQLRYPQPPFDFSHAGMEPAGMAGPAKLYIK